MAFSHAGRATEIELMDAGAYDREELRSNLSDLRFYNTWLGGARLVTKAVAGLLSEAGNPPRATVLDLATGLGDIPATLARWGERRSIDLHVAGLELNPAILGEAQRYLGGRGTRGVCLTRGDATCLPFADGSADIVVCSNFLHHLDGDAARKALGEMRRVTRLGLVAVDLIRSRLAWLNVWLLTRLTTSNRLTRNDGPLSVKRAFTAEELRATAEEAGLRGSLVRPAGPVRMVLTWSKKGSKTP